ncbi:MAG: class I SAM-dependent methyltransferase [Candidatus Blackburnbacteria bacterium]|nr:class I SAM-dependent methyltransferase [Candidatus Blackburnbacteria bacterium]
METPEYKNIFENEKSHFFYVANHKIALSLVKKYAAVARLKILDAGCGTGLLAKKLERFGGVWGIDISPEAVRFAKKRGVRVQKASVEAIPFKDKFFDLVVSVDVIYHKAVDDKKALREFFRVLKPGGVLVLRVPATPILATSHDKHVHTRERYTKSMLIEKLIDAGFIVEKVSGVNLLLAPIALTRHFWEKIMPPSKTGSGVVRLPRLINSILAFLLSLEVPLLGLFNLPTGLGLIAVCRKPTQQNILG